MRLASAFAFALALAAPGRAQPLGCRVSATPVSFGLYDTFAPLPLDATGEISVFCPGAQPVIRLAIGGASGGGAGPRKMREGTGRAFLAYDLYRDAARSEVWGDGTGSTFVERGEGRHVVYGRLPARQSVPPGTYSDTIVVTVEW